MKVILRLIPVCPLALAALLAPAPVAGQECVFDGGSTTVEPCYLAVALRSPGSVPADLHFTNVGQALRSYTVVSSEPSCTKYVPHPWLSPNWAQLQIPPLGSSTLSLVFSASGELKEGAYKAWLCLDAQPPFAVPVWFTYGDPLFINGFDLTD